ncbi:MAG TPA: hypothetical protein VM802_21755 [Chitinophaga sp.]|uniref:terpene synthase family protein n=1 Tax=Chitinophaga sp. TaxID=1869181 RepID=UPI002B6E661B|nr:hypothetical protein [Chitinophaga sp.]HVI47513.1 hypothetical protein [Chitinophaga sp.]
MYSVLLPALQCPIAPAIHPLVALAENHTDKWLRRFNLLREHEYEIYRRQGFAYMVARMFPTARTDILFAITDINTLLFLLDDQIDHQQDLNTGIGEKNNLKHFVGNFLTVLTEHRSWENQHHPALAALAEFWERMCNITSIDWQHRFVASIQDTFNAALWQLNNISNHRIPPIEEYVRYRNYLGAANIATDTIYAVTGLQEDWGKLNTVIDGLTLQCRNIVCWANDLYSLSKEIEQKDIYNLVSLIQYHGQVDQEEAISRAMNKHNNDMDIFIKESELLLKKNHSNDLFTYVTSLMHIIRGNVDWSEKETTRYKFSYK